MMRLYELRCVVVTSCNYVIMSEFLIVCVRSDLFIIGLLPHLSSSTLFRSLQLASVNPRLWIVISSWLATGRNQIDSSGIAAPDTWNWKIAVQARWTPFTSSRCTPPPTSSVVSLFCHAATWLNRWWRYSERGMSCSFEQKGERYRYQRDLSIFYLVVNKKWCSVARPFRELALLNASAWHTRMLQLVRTAL